MKLSEFPAEVLVHIYIHLRPGDMCRLSRTCRRLQEAFYIERIWEEKARREFNIDLSANNSSSTLENRPTARKFYLLILRRYGRALGLWQRQNVEFYGALFQVAYENWSLRFFEWAPPLRPEDPIRPQDFLSVSLKSQAEIEDEEDAGGLAVDPIKYTMLHPWWKPESVHRLSSKGPPQKEDVVLVYQSDNHESMSIYPDTIAGFTDEDGEENSVDYYLESYVLAATDKTYSKQELMDHRRELNMVIAQFITRFNSRNVHGFKRPDPIYSRLVKPPPSKMLPPPGIFKGHYGAHGVEFIAVTYNQDKELVGTKLTGDPNVPFRAVSFRSDATKTFVLPAEEQKITKCKALQEMAEDHVVPIADNQVLPFHLPEDCVFEKTEFIQCKARLVGSAQLAETRYTNPHWVPAHVVVFSDDVFGVLFFGLRNFIMYYRAEERWNVADYDNIFPTTSSCETMSNNV